MATLTFVVCPLCVYVCALPSSVFTWQPLPISCVGNVCQVYYYMKVSHLMDQSLAIVSLPSMQAFIAGIQDVIEPTFTFVLAWALGTAMQVCTTWVVFVGYSY